MFESSFYIHNRARLAESMKDGSIYLNHSGQHMESTYDECFSFEVYRNFYYLTGVNQPEAVLLLCKLDGKVSEILFMHVPTPMEQRWMNLKWDPEGLKQKTGIKMIMPIENLDARLSRMLVEGRIQDCYMDLSRWDMHYAANGMQKLAHKLHESYPYMQMHNAFATVAKMRTVKAECEIEAHRKACAITEKAVRHMMKNIKPGMKEYEIEAYYDFVLKSSGVKRPAFTTIAATGSNATHMHYVDNDTVAKDGELILFDLGARWDYYCADVSRTYPVNGKFTERQVLLYNTVLKGLKAAEEASRPGVVKDELQLLSKKVMAEELLKFNKIHTAEEIDKYYMHSSGHFIGMDTHDVGDHGIILEKNMMFTLEPGLYFDDEETGIRIEDTMVVTDDGIDVFSSGIPKEIAEIEKEMAE